MASSTLDSIHAFQVIFFLNLRKWHFYNCQMERLSWFLSRKTFLWCIFVVLFWKLLKWTLRTSICRLRKLKKIWIILNCLQCAVNSTGNNDLKHLYLGQTRQIIYIQLLHNLNWHFTNKLRLSISITCTLNIDTPIFRDTVYWSLRY